MAAGTPRAKSPPPRFSAFHPAHVVASQSLEPCTKSYRAPAQAHISQPIVAQVAHIAHTSNRPRQPPALHRTGERRLCTCTAHRIETTEHVVLECELYAAQREPLTEAITEWSASMQGLSAQEALHWAINDKLPSPVMLTEDRMAAGTALRAAVLDFHRLVKSIQYIKPRDAAPQPPAVD